MFTQYRYTLLRSNFKNRRQGKHNDIIITHTSYYYYYYYYFLHWKCKYRRKMTKSSPELPSLSYLTNNIPPDTTILPVLTGIAGFGLTLALSTATQKFVGISTGTKILPTVCGFVSVCAASLVSERTAILTHEWRTNPQTFQKNLKDKFLLATSSSSNQQQASLRRRRSSRQRYHSFDDDDHNNNRNNNDHSWIRINKLPVHEIRV